VNQKTWSLASNVAAVVYLILVPYNQPTKSHARIGHPSCMALETLGEVVRSYPWKCLECKNCEVCQEKGDDVSFSNPLIA
jgi:hypothetical protein